MNPLLLGFKTSEKARYTQKITVCLFISITVYKNKQTNKKKKKQQRT